MRIIIHACPKRMWYVSGFLMPKLLEQGIPKEDLLLWNDVQGRGNLDACMDAFAFCGQNDVGGTWHLQDDVLPSFRFKEYAETYTDDIVCGSVMSTYQSPDQMVAGLSTVDKMWYSFQCIRISDKIAGECEEWFRTDGRFRPEWGYRVEEKKYDDSFFMDFMTERHPGMLVNQPRPNLVNHVDKLLGGSVLTKRPASHETRSTWFEDHGEEAELLDWLAKNGR